MFPELLYVTDECFSTTFPPLTASENFSSFSLDKFSVLLQERSRQQISHDMVTVLRGFRLLVLWEVYIILQIFLEFLLDHYCCSTSQKHAALVCRRGRTKYSATKMAFGVCSFCEILLGTLYIFSSQWGFLTYLLRGWREWWLSPVFLLGIFHGQRSRAVCSLWGHKESDRTERLTLSLSIFTMDLGWNRTVSDSIIKYMVKESIITRFFISYKAVSPNLNIL